MRLKVITTALMITGVAMLLAFPLVIGPQPARSEGQRALAEYAIKFGSYIIIAVLIFAGAIVCSIIMLRQIRKDMRVMAEHNMQAFVSGTLEDHATKEARRKKFDEGGMQEDLRDYFSEDELKLKSTEWKKRGPKNQAATEGGGGMSSRRRSDADGQSDGDGGGGDGGGD
jgi:uncharacterized membrane protein YgcG